MRKMKRGRLESGKSGRKVKNPKQAIAIGLSEARRKGAKVPPKQVSRSRSGNGSVRKRNTRARAVSSKSRAKSSRSRSR
jgi:hypothetical protein